MLLQKDLGAQTIFLSGSLCYLIIIHMLLMEKIRSFQSCYVLLNLPAGLVWLSMEFLATEFHKNSLLCRKMYSKIHLLPIHATLIILILPNRLEPMILILPNRLEPMILILPNRLEPMILILPNRLEPMILILPNRL